MEPVLPPVITGVAPATATNAGVATLKISGNYFQEGLSVYLHRPGQDLPGIIISATTTTVVATFNLTNQALGRRDIIVANPDDQRGTLTSGFEVVAPLVATIKVLCNKDGSFVFWGPSYKGKISGGEFSFPVLPGEKKYLEVSSPDFQQQYLEEINIAEIKEILVLVTFE